MTAPDVTFAEPLRRPTPHPAWCQPAHCKAFPDWDSIHRHLIGRVSIDVEVWVERNDDTNPDGSNRYGTPEVYVYGSGSGGLSAVETDTLMSLLGLAKMFAAEIAGVR